MKPEKDEACPILCGCNQIVTDIGDPKTETYCMIMKYSTPNKGLFCIENGW